MLRPSFNDRPWHSLGLLAIGLAAGAVLVVACPQQIEIVSSDGGLSDGGVADDGGDAGPPPGRDAGHPDASVALQCWPDGGAPVPPACTADPSLSKGPPATILPVGQTKSSGPHAVISVDLNCDGFTDLAILDYEGSLQVLLGGGDGGFRVLAPTVTGPSPDALAAGDFNGDGFADVAYTSGSSVWILIGRGDGTFNTGPQSFPVDLSGNGHGIALAVGDVNHDKQLDLVIADNASVSAQVSVLLGNGDGTFQAPQSYAVGNGAYGVTLADLNQDGWLDIAATTNGPAASPSIAVLFNRADGTFGPASLLPIPNADVPDGVVAADFDGDGRLDLAAVGSLGDHLDVILNLPDGGFAAAVSYLVPAGDPTDPEPVGPVLGDFNGDGIPDLAAANTLDGTAALLVGDGTGRFFSGGTFSVAMPGTNQPQASAIAAWSAFASVLPHDLAVTDATNGPNLDTGTVTLLESACP